MSTSYIRTFVYRTFFIIVLFGCCFSTAHAAQITLEAPTTTLAQNQKFAVRVLVDPLQESINTVSLGIAFPDLLTYEGADTSHSILQMWVERPKENKADHTVTFSGIIPGGFSGFIDPFHPKDRQVGEVVTLFFSAHQTGTATLVPGAVQVLLNDGKGTATGTVARGASVLVGTESLAPSIEVSSDTTPPIPFTPIILDKQNAFFQGKYALIFDTTDADSGIDHYEVREGARTYVRAESPYILLDQTLSGPVFVKAVDRAHNERIEQVTLPKIAFAHTYTLAWIGLAVVLIAFCVILMQVWFRTSRHSQK